MTKSRSASFSCVACSSSCSSSCTTTSTASPRTASLSRSSSVILSPRTSSRSCSSSCCAVPKAPCPSPPASINDCWSVTRSAAPPFPLGLSGTAVPSPPCVHVSDSHGSAGPRPPLASLSPPGAAQLSARLRPALPEGGCSCVLLLDNSRPPRTLPDPVPAAFGIWLRCRPRTPAECVSGDCSAAAQDAAGLAR